MIAYCDCFSGVSGDMLLGALVDAGLPLETLSAQLSKLGLDTAYTLDCNQVRRGDMRASKMDVKLRKKRYHRSYTLAELTDLIEGSSLSMRIRDHTLQIFQRLTEAEAYAHALPVEQVRFHDLAIPDLIVDIVGTVIGLEGLEIEALYASPLPLSCGQVKFSHSLLGPFPQPGPTTLELISRVRAPTRPVDTDVELVTPTGAAILTTLAAFHQPAMRIHRVGVGAGGYDLPWPNVFRLWVGELL